LAAGDGVAFSGLVEGAPGRRYGAEIDAHRAAQARTLGIEVLQANRSFKTKAKPSADLSQGSTAENSSEKARWFFNRLASNTGSGKKPNLVLPLMCTGPTSLFP